jgi:hypothetical protein
MFKRVIKYHIPSANNENGKFTHVILNEPNNSRTFASGILLANYLRKLEIEYYSKKYNIDISKPDLKKISNYSLLKIIRQAIQRKFLEKSKLICEYCNTSVNLTMNNSKRRNNQTATVDHFVPIICGYDPFDESNYRVCCYKCNGEKGELTYDQWMKKKLNKV